MLAGKARKREVIDGKRVLFPVRLVGLEMLRDWESFDGNTGKDSAREIRSLARTEHQLQMLETLPNVEQRTATVTATPPQAADLERKCS
jgi:hypothetical protein